MHKEPRRSVRPNTTHALYIIVSLTTHRPFSAFFHTSNQDHQGIGNGYQRSFLSLSRHLRRRRLRWAVLSRLLCELRGLYNSGLDHSMPAKDRSHRNDDLESDDTALPLLTIDSASRLELADSDAETNRSSTHAGPQSLSHYQSRKYRERVDTIAPKYAKRTPLPLMQLVVLCAMRMAEPVAYTQIFPVRFRSNISCLGVLS